MKHIAILIPEGAILNSIEGPRQLFAQVNHIFTARGEAPPFSIQLVGLHAETRLSGGRFTANADCILKDARTADLVIIPAIDGDLEQAMRINQDFIPWIVTQYKQGGEIASLCLGAFLLASTGLLDGRQCATHWLSASLFRKMFPQVNLMAERVITDERGIYSSGGAYSYLNLILYLIEKFTGRETAILSAKIFAVEIDRDNQSPFIIFQGQKDHEDDVIRKAQIYIEKNYREKITVSQLASMLAVGRRNLERRFKKATANTVVEYIQRVKIEAAKMNLENSRDNVNEVMYKVGYSDTKAFRTAFKRITGLSPIHYRNKYNRDAIALPS